MTKKHFRSPYGLTFCRVICAERSELEVGCAAKLLARLEVGCAAKLLARRPRFKRWYTGRGALFCGSFCAYLFSISSSFALPEQANTKHDTKSINSEPQNESSTTVNSSTAKSSTSKPSVKSEAARKIDDSLLNFQADQAIRLLCTPLNRTLAEKNYVAASSIMRLIASAFRMDENDAAALQAVQIALKLNPKDEYCRFQTAEYLQRVGQCNAAENIYEELSKSSDANIALRARAFLSQAKGALSDSIGLLAEYTRKKEKDSRALLKLGYLYLIAENKSEAAAVQKKLADATESNYLKQIYLGRAEEAEDKTAQAEKYFNAAGKLNPDDPLWHCQLAIMLMKKGRAVEADRQFRACFASKRLMSQAFMNWAMMQSFFGSKTKAEECLEYALQLRPDSSELHFTSGVVQEKSGKLTEAEKSFERAIALNPRNTSSYMHLLLLNDARNLGAKKRLELCRKWQTNCPQSNTAKIELGNSLVKNNEAEEALKYFRMVEEHTKDKTISDKNLQMLLCTIHATIATLLYEKQDQKGSLNEAMIFNRTRPIPERKVGLSLRLPTIDLAKQDIKTKPAAEHALIADSLYECGHLAAAEHEYREAQKSDPNNINYHSCLLKVLIDKKDYAGAAKEDAAVSSHIVTHVPDLFNSSADNKAFMEQQRLHRQN